MTEAILEQKRQELLSFVQQEIVPEPAVQAVIAIGSLAMGTPRPDSDIDAVVFLDPFDPYAVPAEFQWRPADRTFHNIFVDLDDAVQFDFKRFDLTEWSLPTFLWPEPLRAELNAGWIAFDRHGLVHPLITERTSYPDSLRLERLDHALVQLDQLLNDTKARRSWEHLGVLIAHDRLQAAYAELVTAVFAYNQRWRPWRSREMSALVQLPWLPSQFHEHILLALNAPGLDVRGFEARLSVLRQLFDELLAQLQRDQVYGGDPIGEAFKRQYREPGRGNLEDWTRQHRRRTRTL